jgi:hypothetical protein
MNKTSAPKLPSNLPLLLGLELVVSPNAAALELAVEAIQNSVSRRTEKSQRASWRQNSMPAIRSLNKLFSSSDSDLLEDARNILQEASKSPPSTDDARLLADALNLDDFGIHGLLQQALRMGATGATLQELLESFKRQEQYGYWEARLKEDFHFEPVRRLAAQRLAHLRKVTAMLKEEMNAGR